jgi:hypothetical protein
MLCIPGHQGYITITGIDQGYIAITGIDQGYITITGIDQGYITITGIDQGGNFVITFILMLNALVRYVSLVNSCNC